MISSKNGICLAKPQAARSETPNSVQWSYLEFQISHNMMQSSKTDHVSPTNYSTATVSTIINRYVKLILLCIKPHCTKMLPHQLTSYNTSRPVTTYLAFESSYYRSPPSPGRVSSNTMRLTLHPPRDLKAAPLGCNMGTGKPAVFPKWVRQVQVQCWILTHCCILHTHTTVLRVLTGLL